MMEVTTAALEPISSALREMLVMALLYIFQDERSTDRASYMGGCASWKEGLPPLIWTMLILTQVGEKTEEVT